ncbi:MAG: hypothetical protein C5B49_12600 [Bdellovibrio sp.]|nr:MAG: hypothetical protein C5B49_12600 [Bdellovibrio sp.]
MGKFEITINKKGNDWAIKMGGTIDEDVDFGQYMLTGAQKIDLHLADIKSINSCGIREWIKWIGATAAAVTYHECPKIIVDQINMVQGFLPGRATVNSFFVPFYCEESSSEKSYLFRLGHEFNSNGDLKIPIVKDDQGHVMEMDVVEAKYFKFLKK